MTFRTVRFWVWLSAIALGTYIGLSLSAGDQDPSAQSSDDGYHLLHSTRELPTTRWTHVRVTGTVLVVIVEEDGDWHIRLSEKSKGTCSKADYSTGICIVAEVRPKDQVGMIKPTKGMRIQVAGVSRFDKTHSWFEVHPVDSITVLSK